MQPGDRIDQYTIQRLLGSGGMAHVYLAWDGANQWPVALKVMNAVAMSNPRLQERFKREVAVASRLRHPHLVQLYDWGQAADGQHYLVMEYIDGGSLAGRINRFAAQGQAFPATEAAYLMRRVAAAVAYAHSKGVIHRDLKPANILIRGDNGEPVVTDLGIAAVSGANPLTGTMETLGTPHYMAPEQASGASSVDARSDVYAMGVMLCEMLCGRLPFEGETSWAILHKKINQDPPKLAQLKPGVDPGLAAIATLCLQRDPARRYQSAGALAAALDEVLPDTADNIAAGSLVAPLSPPTAGRQVTPASEASTLGRERLRSVSPLWLIGGAALVLLLIWMVASAIDVGGPSEPVAEASNQLPAAAEMDEVEPVPVSERGRTSDEEGGRPGGDAPAPTSTTAVVAPEAEPTSADLPSSEAPAEEVVPASPSTVLVPDEIVFQSNRDGDYEIFIMSVDGDDQRQLTRNLVDDRYPRVSPDGHWIAFESARDGSTFEIYIMRRDGSEPQRLTFNSYNDRLPAWSPDSSQLVFSRWVGNDSELFVMDRSGSNERQITFTDVDEGHASWSPDGRIVYNADQLGASYWQLYMINVDGSGWQRLTTTTFDEWSPEWSPDGRQILFLSELESRTNPAIYIMDADGSNVRQLYDGPTMEWGAVWSPDGSKIAFAVDQPDDTADIYVMDVNGGQPRRLTRGGYPSWAAAIETEAAIPGLPGRALSALLEGSN